MTAVKLCGMTRACDIEKANELKPEYIGFVFFEKSRRAVTKEQAAELRTLLDPSIRAVGVFVDPDPAFAAELLNEGIIDAAQLHGHEDSEYIRNLRALAPDSRIIQAVKVRTAEDIRKAEESIADDVLLDSGAGSGETFDWSLIRSIQRPYFLAGGLGPDNVQEAVGQLHPYAVDVSSGIETDGLKDPEKMERFVQLVRGTD